jgi:energy-coupling factor transport system permease protein
MLSLTERGFPPMIAYIVLTTIQIVPRFQARAATILDAQRSRGLETEGSLPHRLRALLPLVVPLILSSLVDVEERAVALEARAFSRKGAKTSLLILRDTAFQRVARWFILFVLAVVLALRFVAGIAP